MAEGQGEDGPGSVGDSGAMPMIVVVVAVDDGGGRRAVGWVGGRRRGNAEEEEDEIERRGELTFSCAGKVRQSLTDRLT